MVFSCKNNNGETFGTMHSAKGWGIGVPY